MGGLFIMKKCRQCGLNKELNDFYRNRNSREGICKVCRLENNRNRYKHTCVVCNKIFRSEDKYVKCCSHRCVRKLKTNRVTKKFVICEKPVTRAKSQFHEGYRVYCSRECKDLGVSKFNIGSNHPRWNELLTYEKRIANRKYPEYIEWREAVYIRDNYTCQCCGDSNGGNLEAHHIYNYSEHDDLKLDVTNGITWCDVCHKRFHDEYGYRNNDFFQFEEYMNKYAKTLIPQ